MRTLNRIGRDYLAQIAAFAASLTDRLLIPGVFLRTLGVTAFSTWGVVLAAASLVSILDLGVTRYLANRLVALVEQGAREEAAILFSEAAGIMLGIAILAPLAIVGLGLGGSFSTGEPAVDGSLIALLIPVSIALSARMFIGLYLVLFRAHGAFRVETWAVAMADLLRTVLVIGGLLLGADLFGLTWIYAGATIATSLLFIPLALRRFRDFKLMVRAPRAAMRRDIVRVAPGLGLSNGFNIAYTAVPTIILGLLHPGAGALAQFILMRTLGNFARQMVNLFSSVFGLELARRQARGDGTGYAKVFAESSRFLAVQVAIGCAIIAVFGHAMFALWTGNGALFSLWMLGAALAPLLLVPNNLLILEALTYHNLPWPINRARILQALVSIAAFVFIPIDSMQLRMLLAISLGEIFGLSIPVSITLAKVAPTVSMRMLLMPSLRGLLVFAVTGLAIWPAHLLGPDKAIVQVVIGACVAAPAFAIAVWFFGLDSGRRVDFTQAFRRIAGSAVQRRRGRADRS